MAMLLLIQLALLAPGGSIEPIVNDNDRRFNPKHNIAFEEIYLSTQMSKKTLHEINIKYRPGLL